MGIATLAVLVCLFAAVLASAEGGKKRILVLSTGNSARSQMSEGFLRSFDPRLEVYSAGTDPAPRVNPFAIRASQFTAGSFDFVITACDDADKSCPNFRGKVGKRVHIGFPDPAQAMGTDEDRLAVFRAVRDDIRKRFREYYETEIKKGL